MQGLRLEIKADSNQDKMLKDYFSKKPDGLLSVSSVYQSSSGSDFIDGKGETPFRVVHEVVFNNMEVLKSITKILIEEKPMTQLKKMKMRINNPDHSKAVQEWLFEQGYKWSGLGVQDYVRFLFINSHENREITYTPNEEYFERQDCEEINVQHLDPHLHIAHKSTCVPARSSMEKPMKSEFEKLSQQLKHLDKAIDTHENKQNKRKLDRQRIIEKMEGMTPGYSLVRKDSVEEPTGCGFNPDEIVVGSVWECVGTMGHFCYFTKGCRYKVVSFDRDNDPEMLDDKGDLKSFWSLHKFKRIS